MKKFFILWLFLGLLTSGCVSYVNHRITTTPEAVTRDYNGKTVSLSPSGNVFSDDIVTIKTSVEDEGLFLEIKNNTLGTIEVDWDRSGYINESGETMRVIHNGVKLINRSDPQVPSIIAAGSKISDSITPAENIIWTGHSWFTGKLITRPRSVMISDEAIKKAESMKSDYSNKMVVGVIALKIGQSTAFYRVNYRLSMQITTGNYELN